MKKFMVCNYKEEEGKDTIIVKANTSKEAKEKACKQKNWNYNYCVAFSKGGKAFLDLV